MPLNRTARYSSVILSAAVIAISASGVTYAATSISGKTIKACVSSSSHLALLSFKGRCRSKYTPLTFNSQGVRGSTGRGISLVASFTVDVYSANMSNRCTIQAQVTPAG